MNVVTVVPSLRWTAEVRGRSAVRLLRRANVPHQFDYRPASGGAPCWTCPRVRVPDLVAAADVTRGVRLVLHHNQEPLLSLGRDPLPPLAEG